MKDATEIPETEISIPTPVIKSMYTILLKALADPPAKTTEITTNSGIYYLNLNASEMNADRLAILFKTSTARAEPYSNDQLEIAHTTIDRQKTAISQVMDLLYQQCPSLPNLPEEPTPCH